MDLLFAGSGPEHGSRIQGVVILAKHHECPPLCTFLEQLDAANPNLTAKQKEQRGLALVNKFYELTYEEGGNISTPEGAARALEELGFATAAEAVDWLKRGGGQKEVVAADTYAKRDMDIDGVPFFVVSGSESKRPIALNGAQDSRAFMRAFSQA